VQFVELQTRPQVDGCFAGLNPAPRLQPGACESLDGVR
jgi:hypothetical protein